MGDAGGELAEGGELFRLDQPVLRLAQVVERGGELLRARLHLVEQAHVFHSDDRLVGESLDDLDLALGEKAGLRTGEDNGAEDPLIAHQRHAEQRPRIRRRRLEVRIVVLVRLDVGDVLNLAGQQNAPAAGAATRLLRVLPEVLNEIFIQARIGFEVERLALLQVDDAVVRIAQLLRRADERVQHRLQIERRAADDLQHVGGRDLLMQRFLCLIEQGNIADRDDSLVRKRCNKLDLPPSEGLHPPAGQDEHAYHFSRANERHTESRALPRKSRRFGKRIFGVDRNIGDLDGPPLENGAACHGPTVDADGVGLEKFRVFSREAD